MNEAIRMQLSAFADGELPDNEKELLLRRLSQDSEMRRQIAEYLAIGRAMRGEVPVRGIERLREQIANAIGAIDTSTEAALDSDTVAAPSPRSRLVRPAAGVGIAAAVALLALFGLRQLGGDVTEPASEPAMAGSTDFPAQPAPDRRLDQYRMLHDAEAFDSGMHSRLTNFEEWQELAEEASDPATAPDGIAEPGDVPDASTPADDD